MRKYKHIFFDLDNTLWDFDRNAKEALKLTFHHFYLDNRIKDFSSFHSVYVGHNDRLWELYRNNGITKEELVRQRFMHTFSEFGLTGIDPLEFNRVFLELMPLQTVLVPGAAEVLNYLFHKGYFLYIITNGFKEVQAKKLEMTGINPFFRKVYISEDIKAQKPSREIFEYALKSSNARKKESIMVGDSWDVDIEGARNAGIDQIYFLPHPEQSDFDSGIESKGTKSTKTFIINDLLNILSIL